VSTAPVSAEEERRYPHWRRNCRVMASAGLLSSLAFGMAWPFLPLMVRSLGIQQNLETWVGYMMLLFYIVSFLMNPVWGGIADHYGRKLMVLRAWLGMGFFMCLLPFAPTPLWFAGLFMLVGIFNGSTAAGNTLLVATTPPSRMGSALSFNHSCVLAGRTAGPAVGALVAALLDREHFMFWISGGLLLTGGTLVACYVREERQQAQGRWRSQWVSSLRELLAVPRMGYLFLLCFLFAVLWSGNVTVISIYMLELYAARPESAGSEAFWVGAAAVGLAVAGLAALPLWGRALDRMDAARIVAITTAGAALTHLPLIFLQTPLQLVLARVAFGLVVAAMQPAIFKLLKEYAPPGMDARAISYASSFQFMAMGLAPFGAGLIGPAFGLRAYFVCCVVLTLCGLVLWLRSCRAGARA